MVRNEFVLRLFLLSALEPAEARAALRELAAENDAVLPPCASRWTSSTSPAPE